MGETPTPTPTREQRLERAILQALDEVGVPGPGYPEPVANAVAILSGSLKHDREVDMSDAEIVVALNEWMRRYIDDPSGFEREWKTVTKYLAEVEEGKEPSYGAASLAYLKKLITELKGGI